MPHPPALPRAARRTLPLALSLAALAVGTASAQPPATQRGDECLGFAFGAWTPPLDARAAGHAPFPPAASLPHAPGGRDWAAADSVARDTLLLLFPSWWPAGVSIHFAHAPRAPGDTARGTATALVADGRLHAPVAKVLAWLVPCSAPPEGGRR